MIGRFPLNLASLIQYNTFTRPFGIAYDPAGGRIAVVDVTDKSVVFLDSTSLSVLNTVSITAVILSMLAFDSSSNRFFVSDDYGKIYAISGVDYSVTTFVTITGLYPNCRSIKISDSRIFFSCYYDGTTTSKVFVYNLSDGSLITSFLVNNACGMDIADSKIWVSCHGANNVKVYDLTTYSLITTISVGVDCYTITNDPDMGYMIIQSRDNNQLKLLRRSDSSIVGALGGIDEPNDSAFINGKIYLSLQTAGKLAILEKFYS